MKITHYRHITGMIVASAGLTLALSGCASATGSTNDSSCTPEHAFSTIEPGVLTVATYEFAPHTKIQGDQLSGIEGDLLNEVAKRECLTLRVDSAGGAAAAVPSVQSGRADLAAGDWWRTQARGKVVALSDPLYLDQGAIISVEGYRTLVDLNDKKLAAVAGSLWNDQLSQVFGDKFAVYQDSEAVYSDLAAGRIDAVIDSVGATTARFESKPITGAQIIPMPADPRVPTSAHPGQVNWPHSKTNSELSAALSDLIAAMREDGTIAETLKKYGVDSSAAEVGQPEEL